MKICMAESYQTLLDLFELREPDVYATELQRTTSDKVGQESYGNWVTNEISKHLGDKVL